MRPVRFLIAALTSVTIAGCGAGTGATAQSGNPSGAAKAADAQELNFDAKTVDGADFSASSLRGKPAVLWFWAPWCPICQREAPEVAAIAHAHPAVTFVGVAAQDGVPAMQDFVSRYHLGFFTHLADVEAKVWRRFGVTQQPAFAFVTTNGTTTVVTDTQSESEIGDRVDALSAG